MKRFVVHALLLASFSSISATEKSVSGEGIELGEGSKLVASLMLSSKFTGMCGVFGQMANFQESTKIPGGDEFMNRFLATELARLNMSSETFIKQCQDATNIYSKYYGEFNK